MYYILGTYVALNMKYIVLDQYDKHICLSWIHNVYDKYILTVSITP